MPASSVVTRDVIAEQLAENVGIPMTQAREEVRWFFDTIAESLTQGDEVRIHGFGSFKTAARAARMARNPRTGETVKVPARRVVRFAPSTTLSDQVKSVKVSAAKRGKR